MHEDLYIEVLPHLIEGPQKIAMRKVWTLIKHLSPLNIGCICNEDVYRAIYDEAHRIIKEWEDNASY